MNEVPRDDISNAVYVMFDSIPVANFPLGQKPRWNDINQDEKDAMELLVSPALEYLWGRAQAVAYDEALDSVAEAGGDIIAMDALLHLREK